MKAADRHALKSTKVNLKSYWDGAKCVRQTLAAATQHLEMFAIQNTSLSHLPVRGNQNHHHRQFMCAKLQRKRTSFENFCRV